MRTEDYKKVNEILVRWDPIGVTNGDVLDSEYSGYVYKIIGIIKSEDSLCLKNLENYLTLMIQHMGLDGSPHDYKSEIKTVAKELFELRTTI
jgi:hypothetical protein